MTELKPQSNKPQVVNEDEIDLIALAKTIWEGRKTIIKTLIIFTFLGLFVAIFSKKEYTASTTMVPQTNNASSKMGGLSSLASLAGFNLDMSAGGSEISPMIYPQIVSSTSFQLEIMNAKYSYDELDEKVTLFDYYMDYYKLGLFSVIKKYTLGLPGLLIGAIKGEQEGVSESLKLDSRTIKLTKNQDNVRKIINEQLNLSVNNKEGYLTLESRFHQAELSAQIAEKAQKLLQDYITRFKIEKASEQLAFIQERYTETKSEFEEAQVKLAIYRDANKNIIRAIAQTEREKLENEYQLSFEVYSELAKQLEQARIKVKEDTPVFSVIEEVVVPIEKSKPKRSRIFFTWIFLGGVVGIGLVFGRKAIMDFYKKWNKLVDCVN